MYVCFYKTAGLIPAKCVFVCVLMLKLRIGDNNVCVIKYMCVTQICCCMSGIIQLLKGTIPVYVLLNYKSCVLHIKAVN